MVFILLENLILILIPVPCTAVLKERYYCESSGSGKDERWKKSMGQKGLLSGAGILNRSA